MTSTLEAIRGLVSSELDQANILIKESIASDIPLAKAIADHIIQSPGKQVRPMLVLLSAKACGVLDQKAITVAAIIELLHTATLLHDDVIDESKQRRGRPTANASFGNEASVLVGDLLYSRAFQLIASLKHHRFTEIIAKGSSDIVEGEVLQLMHCHDPATQEATYIDIVKRKTGVLFEIAAISGPILADASLETQEAMRTYGQNLGAAFQMLDDALDYEGDPELTGKNLGDDLQEGKPTLPLIYVMQQGANHFRTTIAQAIKNPEQADLAQIQKILNETQALTYCKELAAQTIHIGMDQLNTLPDSASKTALEALANFVIERQQ
ncbi:MAG: octaprenyl diphosphate synthase [Gammaproteobacteria bacterium CG11_big_fil_rev_8_21_14_0_20_46_22]|nr:MAG: octaprenyl diphosphate synthase [Gammaproteobacteria bacterium CG12_big_fil_rev_8_21_14_0_65_46_12]PIR10447.1 MAG: octaprenyl diphosphate synthase [Gammaproteobacteria bacterium CG11_big_fil_rev_8_21_14_0_20_46_22]